MAEIEDTTSTRALCSAIRARISELDSCILALQESLPAAHDERAALQSRLDDYKYPILTLPIEITSEIFIHFLPIYPLPLRLLGSYRPSYWDGYARSVNLEMERLSCQQLNLPNTWLTRSKKCPLSLSIQSHTFPFRQPSHLRLLTDTIFAHSAHMEYMELLIPFRDLNWGGIQGPFPLLRSLTFGPSDTLGPRFTVTPFCDAPLLTTIHLSENFDPYQVELPWSQLTRITVRRCDPTDVAHILRHAVSLVQFGGTPGDDFFNRGTEAYLSDIPPLLHLNLFILHDDESTAPGTQKPLLEALILPALQHLTVSQRDLGPHLYSSSPGHTAPSYLSASPIHGRHCMRKLFVHISPPSTPSKF
ncbi:hypothetical protein C8J57DRAFT_1583532 [Mycena rebaudengoi]|nr:hypothetical protein C8J57DRAFT_1583532 [Mycena rebaudengoi]